MWCFTGSSVPLVCLLATIHALQKKKKKKPSKKDKINWFFFVGSAGLAYAIQINFFNGTWTDNNCIMEVSRSGPKSPCRDYKLGIWHDQLFGIVLTVRKGISRVDYEYLNSLLYIITHSLYLLMWYEYHMSITQI